MVPKIHRDMSALVILSPRTVPNMSVYGPDYLFQAVIGVWGGGTPVSRAHLKTYRMNH